MALNGGGDSRRSSIVGGASCDSDTNFLCNQCMVDTKQTESVVYCLECNEHLCDACRRIHRRIKVSRDHFLIHLGCDPSEGETEVCEEHPGKMVGYFCNVHQKLCCSSCVNIDHKDCDSVTDIRTQAKGVKDSSELQECLSELDRLKSKFQGLVDFKEKQNRDIIKQRVGNISAIQKLRSRVNTVFDHLEKEAVRETDTLCDARIGANCFDAETHVHVSEKLHRLSERLQITQAAAGEAQIYITMKRSCQQIRRFQDTLKDIEHGLTDVTFTFHQNEVLVKMMGKIQQLGNVCTDYIYLSKPPTPTSPRFVMPKKAVPVGGHSVRNQDDKTTCNIKCIAIMPDGRICLADYGNKRLKLFNPNFSLVGHLGISSRPLSIVILDLGDIMVSSADENSLIVCHIDNTITQTRQIQTSEKYVSLTPDSSKDQIYASCYHDSNDGRIHVLDRGGNVKAVIGQTNSLTLMRPSAILLDNLTNVLYVNDIGRNCVIGIDVSRFAQYNIVFQYTDRALQLHDGIAVGNDGSVYVSSRNGAVHQISNMGDKINEILTKRNGINGPTCLAFGGSKNTLYVAEQKHNSIKMFSVL